MPEPILVTGLMVAGYSAALALSRPSSAVSLEATAVQNSATCVVKRVQSSIALFGPKASAISTLVSLAQECQLDNWDGYGALPVDDGAIEMAKQIISSLPASVPMPEFSIEPDGEVSMDWTPTPSRTLTLSAGKTNRIPYAWIDGTDSGHGVAKFDAGQLPARILTEVSRTLENAPSLRTA